MKKTSVITLLICLSLFPALPTAAALAGKGRNAGAFQRRVRTDRVLPMAFGGFTMTLQSFSGSDLDALADALARLRARIETT